MKEFQSVFRNELEEYLKINQGTVNEDTLRNTRRVLLSFDSSLAEENTNVISEAAVNRWIREIRQTNAAKTVSDKVSYLRKFLRYLQYKGYRVFMPDCPKTSDSYVPYIFSDEEIQILLARADSWADKHTDPKICQTDMEFCMLLRMLLGCGFRLGEPLAAKVKDINFQSGTILIRHAKNNKQRVVPMDVTLTQMLERYCIAMGIKNRAGKLSVPVSQKQRGCRQQRDFRFTLPEPFTGNRPVCSGQGPFKRPVPSLFPPLFCHPFLCAGRTERTASGRFCALPVGLSWTP